MATEKMGTGEKGGKEGLCQYRLKMEVVLDTRKPLPEITRITELRLRTELLPAPLLTTSWGWLIDSYDEFNFLHVGKASRYNFSDKDTRADIAESVMLSGGIVGYCDASCVGIIVNHDRSCWEKLIEFVNKINQQSFGKEEIIFRVMD